MEFAIYSRPGIEQCAPHDDVDHVILSIRTPRDPHEVRLPVCARTLGILHLVFHDLDEHPPAPPVLEQLGFSELEIAAWTLEVSTSTLFSVSMGKQVVDFIRIHQARLRRVIAHCDACLSRSPAVAAALASGVFEESDAQFFTAYHPNRRVYRAILEAAHADTVGLEAPSCAPRFT